MVLYISVPDIVKHARSWVASYAMPALRQTLGRTDLAWGRMVLSAYARAMRCPVLAWLTLLSAYAFATQCPDPAPRSQMTKPLAPIEVASYACPGTNAAYGATAPTCYAMSGAWYALSGTDGASGAPPCYVLSGTEVRLLCAVRTE
eukprot:1141787-Rhodomonas_salina.4